MEKKMLNLKRKENRPGKQKRSIKEKKHYQTMNNFCRVRSWRAWLPGWTIWLMNPVTRRIVPTSRLVQGYILYGQGVVTHFYIETYFIRWVTTSWTDSIMQNAIVLGAVWKNMCRVKD